MKCDNQLEKSDIRVDCELLFEKDFVNAYIETWFDAKQKFNLPSEAMYVNLYADYNFKKKELKMKYVIFFEDGTESNVIAYDATTEEKHLIKSMMEEKCQQINSCSLFDCWQEYTE